MEQEYTANPSRVSLPSEIILLIVESLAPARTNITLPPSHEITKTLVALTRVCRAAAAAASKLLWQFCSHIDSLKRLVDFRTALDYLPQDDTRRPTSLFLAVYEDDSDVPDVAWTPHNLPVPSPQFDDIQFATAVQGLLLRVAPTLRRLVIHMPRLAQDHDRTFELLRVGYEALVNLEEFVSIGDRFSFAGFPRSAPDRDVWVTCWPKLRRLALDISLNKNVFKGLTRLPKLETVVFSFMEYPVPQAAKFRDVLLRALNTYPVVPGIEERKLLNVGLFGGGCELSYAGTEEPNRRTRIWNIDAAVFADPNRPYESDNVRILRGLERKISNGTLWEVSRWGLDD
ncbi:hypothetical protein BGZ61DRAFT_449093 [Ilyonectria robusta]|uniref:uncharacterized protein n=1 Tax=Ilyonectria robusta TaxID=1079257 RepID=UPI001E8CCAD3|nr:uncharacterized protein BGZ61DRAFT_449093 [Ilyonectria robusta]KAH8714466.1 hypothetical protein BGZ61DRAFT_449093 [Ilyonectria robusta]